MYYINSVEIKGFWGKYKAKLGLHPDINILIGKNGSGKTNFMNLLQALLSVDIKMLANLEYNEIIVRLKQKSSIKTIKVNKGRYEHMPFEYATYWIGSKKFEIPLIVHENGSELYYRRAFSLKSEEVKTVKELMNSIINISSLSVHRTSQNWIEDEYLKKNKTNKPSIDQRLEDLMAQFTTYQLTLSKQADEVSIEFQKAVLASTLYDKEFDSVTLNDALDFDREKVGKDLRRAYVDLGANNPGILNRIDKHIKALDNSVNAVKEKLPKQEGFMIDDITPLPLLKRTQHIINLSIDAQQKKKTIFQPITAFLAIVSEFMIDKNLKINTKGQIEVTKDSKEIQASDLSSGEKQILILLTESLLQKNEFFIFLADEPELSLHIEWQSKVISSIKKLNSNTQVIIATHSPEITAGWKDKIFDMEDLING